MASFVFAAGLANLLQPSRNTARVLRAMLMDIAYDTTAATPATAQDAATLADVNANEIATIAGYTRGFSLAGTTTGRRDLANVTVAIDNTLNRVTLDADDLVFASLGASGSDNVGGVLIFIQGTSDSDSIPLVFCDTSAARTNGQNLTWVNGALFASFTTV